MEENIGVEDNVIIPCEFCNEFILADQYPSHLVQCFARNNARIIPLSIYDNFLNIDNQNQGAVNYNLNDMFASFINPESNDLIFTNSNINPESSNNDNSSFSNANLIFNNMIMSLINSDGFITSGFTSIPPSISHLWANTFNEGEGDVNEIFRGATEIWPVAYNQNEVDNEVGIEAYNLNENGNETGIMEEEIEPGPRVGIEEGNETEDDQNRIPPQLDEFQRRSRSIRSIISQYLSNSNRNIVESRGRISRYGLWINLEPYNDYDFNTNLANILGKVEVGLTNEQINEISEIYENENLLGERCPICLEEFVIKPEIGPDNIEEDHEEENGENQKDTIKRRLKCSHIFCNPCIIKWLGKHKKCPCCQVDLEDKFLK